MHTKHILYYLIIFAFTLHGCKKDFLNKKPDKALIIPVTLNDLQLLLDNNLIMNIAPAMPLISSDDFYTTTDAWQALSTATERNSYIWANDVYEGGFVADWNTPYQQVFYANVVLDRLAEFSPNSANQEEYHKIKGSALFYRAMAFYHFLQVFAAPYHPANAAQTPGIMLRLSSDVNQRPGRSSLLASYEKIVDDLIMATSLLPEKNSPKTRPSKWASSAMLSRVYQTMQNYTKAKTYASATLSMSNKLLDYNTLLPSASRPFPTFATNTNDEIIFYATLSSTDFGVSSSTMIIEDLYKSYVVNDLRAVLFCNNRGNNVITFKGNYTGINAYFGGLATDEIYLIRAECYAREGNSEKAMEDLNKLMITRWASDRFVPFTASSSTEALKIILKERRKQLISRGTRWTDLRRLNQEPEHAVSLQRNINGTSYLLKPQDQKYTFPIPMDELSDKVVQNPR